MISHLQKQSWAILASGNDNIEYKKNLSFVKSKKIVCFYGKKKCLTFDCGFDKITVIFCYFGLIEIFWTPNFDCQVLGLS